MSPRAASWLAWSVCALTIVFVGFSATFSVVYRANLQGLTFLAVVVSSAFVGAVVASRRPRNPVGWFFVVSAVTAAMSEATFRYAVYGLVIDPGSLPLARAMALPETWMWLVSIVLILLFLPLYFLNGRLLSSRWRPALWLAIALSVVASVYFALLPGEVSDVAGVTNPLGIESLRPIGRVMDVVLTVLFLVAVLCSVASLMVRFRRSRGEERQQMKWLTYATAAMFAVLLIVMPLPDDATWYPVVDSLTSLVFGGMPVAVGIAVLRYRLYEIDLLINRTLVYGALTALLVTVYVGGVVLLQGAFRAFTGQESQLAIVASTLAVAALFNPLRRRIQAFIDRYFYRRKYDARKTLEAYLAKLRDETNLEALNTELVGVVRETMQPAHVSLWLRPDTTSTHQQTD